MTNTEKKAIIINVIYTNRNGAKKEIKMNLRHYLQAKKVRPLLYEPADENSKLIASKIPLDMIPSGTTQADVEAYEAAKGTIKGTKTNKFDDLIDAMEKGIDVVDAANIRFIQESEAVNKVIPAKTESIADITADLTEAKPAAKPAVVSAAADNLYSRADLDAMDSEQIGKIISSLTIAQKMKDQLSRMKDKNAQKDQLFTLLSGNKK